MPVLKRDDAADDGRVRRVIARKHEAWNRAMPDEISRDAEDKAPPHILRPNSSIAASSSSGMIPGHVVKIPFNASIGTAKARRKIAPPAWWLRSSHGKVVGVSTRSPMQK